MAMPTREEYEETLKRRDNLLSLIINEKKAREDLINKLCTSQTCLNNYEALLSNANEVIQKYQIYQELLKNESGIDKLDKLDYR